MATKYQPIRDDMFESDNEAELDEAREDNNGETVFGQKASAMVEQVTQCIGVVTLPTGGTDPSPLDSSVKEEQVELKERCHICGSISVNLDRHILAIHREEVKCQMCGQTFSVGSLRGHILIEHCHNNTNQCSLCEQNFLDKNAMEKHIK